MTSIPHHWWNRNPNSSQEWPLGDTKSSNGLTNVQLNDLHVILIWSFSGFPSSTVGGRDYSTFTGVRLFQLHQQYARGLPDTFAMRTDQILIHCMWLIDWKCTIRVLSSKDCSNMLLEVLLVQLGEWSWFHQVIIRLFSLKRVIPVSYFDFNPPILFFREKSESMDDTNFWSRKVQYLRCNYGVSDVAQVTIGNPFAQSCITAREWNYNRNSNFNVEENRCWLQELRERKSHLQHGIPSIKRGWPVTSQSLPRTVDIPSMIITVTTKLLRFKTNPADIQFAKVESQLHWINHKDVNWTLPNWLHYTDGNLSLKTRMARVIQVENSLQLILQFSLIKDGVAV